MNILIWTDLGTVGLDISCLKSLTKSGHLYIVIDDEDEDDVDDDVKDDDADVYFLMSETYLAFGLRKRQLMSHMNGPSRGLIATYVYMVMVMVITLE